MHRDPLRGPGRLKCQKCPLFFALKQKVIRVKIYLISFLSIFQCYYVGGTEDAATYILKDITKPLAYYKPVLSICESLKKKDSQICELAYEKELDWKNVNLKKMRVKQLKNILANWDETCSGCLEKSDYIRRIEAVKNKHVEL